MIGFVAFHSVSKLLHQRPHRITKTLYTINPPFRVRRVSIMTQNKPCYPNEGIIVEASLDSLRRCARRVLCEFTESLETEDSSKHLGKTPIDEGDYIIFRENVGLCPALIVVTKLGEEIWLVSATAECSPIKCDDRMAMKCSRLNSQNLRIFRECVSKDGKTASVSKWRIELAEDSKIQMIVDRTTERWTH